MNLYREEAYGCGAIHLWPPSEKMIAFLSIVATLLAIRPALTTFPEVASYAKVSKFGQESRSTGGEPFSWLDRFHPTGNITVEKGNEGRAAKDILITVSPVYIPPRTPKLKYGEAIDYPSTPKYSTLDHEMLGKLNDAAKKKEIEARFHPPASFEHSVAHANAVRQKNPGIPTGSTTDRGPPPPNFSGTYDFQPEFLADKPISKPISIDSFPAANPPAKEMDSYEPQPDSYRGTKEHLSDFPDFSSGPPDFSEDEGLSFDSNGPSKPIEYSSEHFEQPPFDDDHHFGDHGYPEVIYDHAPDFHHHHHHHVEHTTMPPEMNDQRLDKRPYSYYFIGKKLWYIPLYFSIYFIIYIAALVLKSISRHKINLPAHLAEIAGHSRQTNHEGWWEFTGRVLEGIESFAQRFGKG